MGAEDLDKTLERDNGCDVREVNVVPELGVSAAVVYCLGDCTW